VKKNTQQYIQWFRHSSPYINAHRGKTFVIWIGGEAVDDDNFHSIIHDINLLNSLGIKLVLVHGARPQIDSQLKRNDNASSFHNNQRITKPEDLESVCSSSALVRTKIEALLSTGVVNSPMHGASIKISSGNYISAKPIGIIDGVNFEHTGETRSVNTSAIKELLNAGHIVLLSNIAYSSTGEIFNINSEDLAKDCAVELKADKLIYFSSEDGIKNTANKLLREISTQQSFDAILTSQHRILKAAINACQSGVTRAHIVSHKINGALIQELFTRDGSGSLVSQEPYETLRQASIDDAGGILELIEPLEQSGVLVKRSREALENEIEYFTVLERDGHIIACAALYIYDDASMAELACICVHNDYQKGNRGDQLLAFIEKQAKFLNIEKLFVLTTQTAHWFLERGFEKAELSELPIRKQSLYNYQRNSLIFFKSL
jgi:amino-acid N-acetyltransferase